MQAIWSLSALSQFSFVTVQLCHSSALSQFKSVVSLLLALFVLLISQTGSLSHRNRPNLFWQSIWLAMPKNAVFVDPLRRKFVCLADLRKSLGRIAGSEGCIFHLFQLTNRSACAASARRL